MVSHPKHLTILVCKVNGQALTGLVLFRNCFPDPHLSAHAAIVPRVNSSRHRYIGYLYTVLSVRNKGLSKRLLKSTVTRSQPKILWLLCKKSFVPYYEFLGFSLVERVKTKTSYEYLLETVPLSRYHAWGQKV